MFLIEPHVEHPPDDEPEMVDPEPVPVEPEPQHRTQFTPKMTKYFNIEDIPPQKWNLRFQEFLAWGFSELNSNFSVSVQQMLVLFTTRLTRTLKV